MIGRKYSKFKVGDQVVRRWDNRVYFICHDIDSAKWEFLISENKDEKVSKCRVAEMYSNLRLATDSEIEVGYAESF